jgi:hypothetical protein
VEPIPAGERGRQKIVHGRKYRGSNREWRRNDSRPLASRSRRPHCKDRWSKPSGSGSGTGAGSDDEINSAAE